MDYIVAYFLELKKRPQLIPVGTNCGQNTTPTFLLMLIIQKNNFRVHLQSNVLEKL